MAAFFVACFFTFFLAALVVAVAAEKGVAVAVAVNGAENAVGAAAKVRLEPKIPTAMHMAVMLVFMMNPLKWRWCGAGCCVGFKTN